MSSVIQVNRIYLIFNPVHFLVDSSDIVSLKDIASYLLITPVYLSRIRKKLAQKANE